MRYERFRLLISTGPAGGYTIQALTPRGEGRARFNPLPIAEASAAFRRLARIGRELQLLPPAASELSPKALGERLFMTLFQGEILRLYERSLDLLAADPEIGLRLELTFDASDADLAALQQLPWELLRQPGTPEFLALSRRLPVVRYLTVARPVYAVPRPRTLCILALAAQPRGLPALDLAREIVNLRQAVGSVPDLKVVMPVAPTLAALRQTLGEQECHVLHFMGHGGSAAAPDHRVLFFETEDGDSAPVRGADLANKLADFPSVRLAVLNACESAAVLGEVEEGTEFDAFSGVASSLVLAGMPAVVAMQFPISDAGAITFSRILYQRLAQGDPVDAAVAEGRQEMHSLDPTGSEWATPVLFLRTAPGELFPEKNTRYPAIRTIWAHRLGIAFIVLLLAGGALLAVRHWWVERLVVEGVALFEHRQWGAARDRFEAALKLAPGSAEVLSNLAGAEEQLGEIRAAETHYREAVERQPGSAEHLYNLGHFLNSRGAYDEAYRTLFQTIAKDPQRADAYGDLAEAAAGQGLLGKARVMLAVALRLDRDRPAFHRRLGELEINAGNPRAALNHLRRARDGYQLGDLGQVETAWLLAQAYDQLGDIPSACQEIREIRHLDPPRITPWAEKGEEVAMRRSCPP